MRAVALLGRASLGTPSAPAFMRRAVPGALSQPAPPSRGKSAKLARRERGGTRRPGRAAVAGAASRGLAAGEPSQLLLYPLLDPLSISASLPPLAMGVQLTRLPRQNQNATVSCRPERLVKLRGTAAAAMINEI